MSSTQSISIVPVTPEERDFRSKKFPNYSTVESRTLLCTICKGLLKHRVMTTKNVHPILLVPICQSCYLFCNTYKNKKNCVWCCSNKDHSFSCDTCSTKFCEKCLKNHSPSNRRLMEREKLKAAGEPSYWTCFRCSPQDIWAMRAQINLIVCEMERIKNLMNERRSRLTISRTQIPLSVNRLPISQSSLRNNNRGRAQSLLPVPVTEENQDNLKPPMPSKEETPSPEARKVGLCIICFDKKVTYAILPCGHLCLCDDCHESYKKDYNFCPMCREKFTSVQKIYVM